MGEPIYKVVWPLGKSAYEIIPQKHDGLDLNGKTICELWDDLFRGDEIFAVVRESLRSRYQNISFIDYDTFGRTHGESEAESIVALPGRLRENRCDAVISAVGA